MIYRTILVLLYQLASAVSGISFTRLERWFLPPSQYLHQQHPDAGQSLSLPALVNERLRK